MLAGLAGFQKASRHQSAHVRSVVAHSLPARFEILIVRARVTSLHDCIVSMQVLAFAGSFHFAKSGPPPSLSRCSMTGSRTRAQQVEWCRCTVHVHVHVYTSRSDRLLFRLAALALRPSEGPQRSALVSPNKMAVLPGPLPDGRRSGGDEGLGSRLRFCRSCVTRFATRAARRVDLSQM